MLRSSTHHLLKNLSLRHGLLRAYHSLNFRYLSSVAANKTQSDNGASDDTSPPKQPFVTQKLEPGEWDIDRKDPYFRPKPPPPRTSKLISAEDFAYRPPVGFEDEFSTYGDAMITLSWLDHQTCREIYNMYVSLMTQSQQQHQRTSHEYAARVIAQKFKITTWRAAGVIQLQHAEEQMRIHQPHLLVEDQALHAENTIKNNIREAYRAEKNYPIDVFVEDPVGIHGRGELDEISSRWTTSDDVYDLEEKLEQANVRDLERARLLIDTHVYKEDVDDSQRPVPTDAACRRLVKAQQGQQQHQVNGVNDEDGVDEDIIPYPKTNSKGEKRPRWKYAAKVVNTRDMKKKGRKVCSYTNNNMYNTLVEEDGKLRVATVEEAHQVAWKPSRRIGNEPIYQGAKKAWLEKTLKGKINVWGRVPTTRASDASIFRAPTESSSPMDILNESQETFGASASEMENELVDEEIIEEEVEEIFQEVEDELELDGETLAKKESKKEKKREEKDD